VRHDTALAHIGCQDDHIGEKMGEVGEPLRLFDGATTNDNSRRSRLEKALHGLGRSNTAANLDIDGCVASDVLDQIDVRADVHGGVDINDMKMPKSQLRPTPNDVRRINDTRGAVAPARRLNTASITQVNRCHHDHSSTRWSMPDRSSRRIGVPFVQASARGRAACTADSRVAFARLCE
jgi:hypothetical protein